ncbi:MAG: hypothetical protein J6M27_11715, partial [Lachnospiraceae bacterium]|nr:hypothetical protein [Lachnospiraceae bacterium]
MIKKKSNDQLNNFFAFFMKNWYIAILLIAIGMEVFLFNFRSWQSFFYREVELLSSDYKTSALELVDADTYRFTDETAVLYLVGLEEKTSGRKLKNVLLELEMPDVVEKPDSANGVLQITPYMRDAGHDRYAVLADHYLREDIPQSQYLWISGMGPVKTLALQIKATGAQSIKIRKIILNARQPIFFVWWRFLITFFGGCVVYGFRRGSVLWKERTDLPGKMELGLTALTGCVLLLPGIYVMMRNDSIILHLSPAVYLSIIVASLLIYSGMYLLLRLLADRIESIPYAYLLLLTAGATMGCQLPFFLNQPDVTALHHVFVEVFLVWGIYLIFRFVYSKQNRFQKRDRKWLLSGTVCLLLAFLWWGVFKPAHEEEWTLLRLWEGIYGYWLKLPECTYVFPYMEPAMDGSGAYKGVLFGGLLVSSPMLLIFCGFIGDKTEEKRYKAILWSASVLIGVAVLIFLLDVFTERITYPNIADFALQALVASAIVWMYLLRRFQGIYAEFLL